MERRLTRTERSRLVLRPDFDHLDTHAALWSDTDVNVDDALATRVREAVAAHLTPRQREIVEWHFFEGASQGEIARRLGLSQQVVQKSLYGTVRHGKMLGGSLRRLRDILAPLVAPTA